MRSKGGDNDVDSWGVDTGRLIGALILLRCSVSFSQIISKHPLKNDFEQDANAGVGHIPLLRQKSTEDQ